MVLSFRHVWVRLRPILLQMHLLKDFDTSQLKLLPLVLQVVLYHIVSLPVTALLPPLHIVMLNSYFE